MGAYFFFRDFRPFAALAVVYFQTVSGSFAAAMSVFSVIMLSSFLFELPTGILSDRIGRKATFLCGTLSYALSIFLFAVAEDTGTLILGAAMGGMAEAFMSGNSNALVYETLELSGRKEDFRDAWGKMRSMGQIALGLASLLGGGLLFMDVSLRSLVWMTFAAQLICLGIGFFLVEPQRHKIEHTNIYRNLGEAIKLFKTNPRLRLVTIANAIQFGIGDAQYRFAPAFFQTVWAPWLVASLSVIRNVFGAIGYWISGRVIKRYGEPKVLLACSAMISFLGIVAVLIQNVLSPFLIFINNLFYGLNDVAKEHLQQEDFDARQRATMSSLSQFMGSSIAAIFAFGLGIVADMSGIATALLVSMVLRLPVVGLYWVLFRKKMA